MLARSPSHHGACVALFALLLACLAAESPAAVYTGSLYSADGGLVVGGDWDYATHTLSWVVSNEDSSPAGWWHYSYTLSVTDVSTDHSVRELGIYDVIVEVSDAFTGENLSVPTGSSIWPGTIGLFTPGASYPGLPDDVFGLNARYDVGYRTAQLDFYSNRVPVWGDFYANAITITGDPTPGWLYNVGFGDPDSDPDPLLFPADLHPGSKDVAGHLLVPDTQVIPAPGALLLGSVGAGLTSYGLRRKRA